MAMLNAVSLAVALSFFACSADDLQAPDTSPQDPECACLERGRSCEGMLAGELCGGCLREPIHGECNGRGSCIWTERETVSCIDK
jgi:hypothetical protein